jgi:hypothetical protein
LSLLVHRAGSRPICRNAIAVREGHIRELPSGSSQAIAYAGTDPLTGKLRYVRETTKTYQAAEVALTRA